MGNLVFICGMPGSGKTSFGKRLASKLSWTFSDLDKVITISSGKSPEQWIKQEGEGSFRMIERDALRNLNRFQNQIVACGGGTPCFYGNLEYMMSTGMCIYLKMTPAAIVSRIKQSKGWQTRPLLGDSPENLDNIVEELWLERKTFYENIEFIVDGLHPNVDEVSKAVKGHFKDPIS
jgi:shikimate kinase